MDLSRVIDSSRRAQFGTTTNPYLHVDQVMTNFVMGYRPKGIIVDRVSPPVTVFKQSDFYIVYDRADTLRNYNTQSRRAPGTEARKVSRQVGSGTYMAVNYALKTSVTVEDNANADPAYRQHLLNQNGMFLTDLLMLAWENRVAPQVTTVANVGSGAGVSSAWTGAASNPIGNINTAINNVHYSTGYRPNKMAMGIQAWNSLRTHPDIRNIIFGTNNGGGYPSTSQVAALFDLEEINVSGLFLNSANEAQAESLSSPWADHVVVYYSGNPAAIEPTAFASFRWAPPGLANMQVERHPFDSKTKSEDLEVGYYQDERVPGPTYAFVLRAVNSNT